MVITLWLSAASTNCSLAHQRVARIEVRKRLFLKRPTASLSTMPSLVAPTARVRDSYIRGEREDAADEGLEDDWLEDAAADFDGFVERRRTVRQLWGVPITELWFVADDTYLGTLLIRHHLTQELADAGGHFGYHVVPSHRRQGHATAMIAQARTIAKELGLPPRLLITCRSDNVASRRAIEANGGTFTGLVDGECHFVLASA
ncbi:MAG: GNAT family N-acetyltransferase [Marmoricola sp.]